MAKKKRTETEAEPEAAEASAGSESTVSKAEAVRNALAEGIEGPEEGVTWIKQKYGIDVPRAQFSQYKSLAKKKGGGNGAGSAKPHRPHAATGNPAELARQVKALVEAHGADAVKQMTDVFAH